MILQFKSNFCNLRIICYVRVFIEYNDFNNLNAFVDIIIVML